MKLIRACELCNADAVVFCPSDAAFLCCSCDAKVHGANFLVARHLRRTVCSGDLISGAGAPPNYSYAPASSSLSSTSSSNKVEYSISGAGAEGVFVDWCSKLGVGGGSASASAVGAACRALKACVDRWKASASASASALPFRVCLAASMWVGLRLTLHSSVLKSKQILKRLHEISGVPPKIIVAAQSKLERALRSRSARHLDHLQLQEGWAEC